MNRSPHENSSLSQLLSIADVVARVRSRRFLPLPRQEPEATERSITKLDDRKDNPLSASDAPRGTENQRRYWFGGKRQPAKKVLLAELESALQHADGRRYAERNRGIVLLSFKAGPACL